MSKKARSKKEEWGKKVAVERSSERDGNNARPASVITPHSKLLSASKYIILYSLPAPARSTLLHLSNHSKTLPLSATRPGEWVAGRSICHEASVPTADLLRNVTCLAARGILLLPQVLVTRTPMVVHYYLFISYCPLTSICNDFVVLFRPRFGCPLIWYFGTRTTIL